VGNYALFKNPLKHTDEALLFLMWGKTPATSTPASSFF